MKDWKLFIENTENPTVEAGIVACLNDKQQFFNAIDIGTGSGNLAITLRLNNSVKKIMGTDISKEAIKVANKNATNLNVSNVSFMHHDFLSD